MSSDSFIIPMSNQHRLVFEYCEQTTRFRTFGYNPEVTQDRLSILELEHFFRDINQIVNDSLGRPRGRFLCFCNFNLCLAIFTLICGAPLLMALDVENRFSEFFFPMLVYFIFSIAMYIFFLVRNRSAHQSEAMNEAKQRVSNYISNFSH